MENQDNEQVLETLSKIAVGVSDEISQLPEELQKKAAEIFSSHLTGETFGKNFPLSAKGYDNVLGSFREDLLPIVEAVSSLEKRFKESQNALENSSNSGRTEDEQIEVIKKQLQIVALDPLMKKLEDISTSMDAYYAQVGFSKFEQDRMKKRSENHNDSVGGFLFGDAEEKLKKESIQQEDRDNGE